MQKCQISLIRYILIQIVHIHYIYSYRLGKKVTLSGVWKCLEFIVRIPPLKWKKGIRKIKKWLDIFEKRALDSCKIHLWKILVHGTGIVMLTHRTIFNRKNSFFPTVVRVLNNSSPGLLSRSILKPLSSKIWIELGKILSISRVIQR